jgi:hypothetical protein
MTDDLTKVLTGVDANRRIAWTKFYEERRRAEELGADYESVSDELDGCIDLANLMRRVFIDVTLAELHNSLIGAPPIKMDWKGLYSWALRQFNAVLARGEKPTWPGPRDLSVESLDERWW